MTDTPMTERKAEIVRVAGRLFADRGYEGASLRHIGDAVGVRRGSLYAHFEAKEEIVELILVPALAGLREELLVARPDGVSAVDHLRDRFEAAVRHCIAHRDAFLILFQDRRLLEESDMLRPVSDQAKAITPLWLTLIEAAQDEGAIRDDLDPVSVAFGLYSLMVASYSDRHIGLEMAAGGALDTDQIVEMVLTLIFDGITA